MPFLVLRIFKGIFDGGAKNYDGGQMPPLAMPLRSAMHADTDLASWNATDHP